MNITSLLITCTPAATILTITGTHMERLWRWATAIPLRTEAERMDAHLALANRLDAMGEPAWASEHRKDAWSAVLHQLAKYEYHRNHRWPAVITMIGSLSYGVAASCVLLGPHRVPAWLPLGALAAFILCATFSVGHQRHLSTRLRAETKERFRRHVEGGDVAQFDARLAALDSVDRNPTKPPTLRRAQRKCRFWSH